MWWGQGWVVKVGLGLGLGVGLGLVEGPGCQKSHILEVQALSGKPDKTPKMISTSLSYLVLLDRAGYSEEKLISFTEKGAGAHGPRNSKLFGSGLWRKVLRTTYLFCCACGAGKMSF